MRSVLSFAALSSLFASIVAHGIVSEVWVGDTRYDGGNWGSTNPNSPVRAFPSDGSYVAYYNVNADDIVCGKAGHDPVDTTAPITAGESVKIRWYGDRGPTGNYWGHYEGPIISYLMRCDNGCTNLHASDDNLRVYKIAEDGLDTSVARPDQGFWPTRPSGDGYWAMDKLSRDQQSWWEVKIPEDTASGEYILRHEMIALQSANIPDGDAHTQPGGGQPYVACIQMHVYNTNDESTWRYPTETPVKSIYSPDDMLLNIYTPAPNGIESYTIPGPSVHSNGVWDRRRMRHVRRSNH